MKIFYINTDKYNVDENILEMFLTGRKFSSAEKKKQHCLGRFIIDKVAREVFNIENSTLEIVNNKPRFKYSTVHFSISHSKNIVLVAFDKNPVGVDVEFMKERNFNEIFARYNYRKENISKELFYKFWTEYEAAIKLQGTPKTKVTNIFEKEFMLSVVGNFEEEISIYELTENGFELSK